MTIVSMVPSWTETLLEVGATVVGRTRYCVHPAAAVGNIPILGGTKDMDRTRLHSLNPDLFILDREENPKAMAEGHSNLQIFATHIESVKDVAPALEKLSLSFRAAGESEVAENLIGLANRWRSRLANPPLALHVWSKLPGVIEWINPPQSDDLNSSKIVYIIWRDPWMLASSDTFIGSVLELLGLTVATVDLSNQASKKYPEIQLESFPPDTVLLFSSEPFPFHKKRAELKQLPFTSCLVDGESFSWFGLRTLRFLEGL